MIIALLYFMISSSSGAANSELLPNQAAALPGERPADNTAFLSGASANLDFLRTFAVLLVVVRHLMSVFHLGDSRWMHPQALGIFGVLLFFVHTSLVLMFSLERQTQKLGMRHFYATFFVRRMFRIYPLSILLVLLCAASALWPVTAGFAEPMSAAGLVSNLMLVQNLTHQPDATAVLWSLPLEMQMYLLLPVLFLNARRLGVTGLLWLWGIGVGLAVLHAKYAALPGIFEYLSCFLPGVLCFVLSRRQSSTTRLPFWLFPVLLAVIFVVYDTAFGVLHRGQALFGMPACLAIGFLLPRFTEMPSRPLAAACKTVARYSYGIYLLHWVVIWLVFVHLHALSLPVQCILFAVGLVLGPVLAYHMVEEPMIKLGNRLVGYIHKSRLSPQS